MRTTIFTTNSLRITKTKGDTLTYSNYLKQSMLQNRFKIIAMAMVMAMFTFSCKNDPDRIGIDIQPESDKLNVYSTDTVTVVAHSIYVDSVRTDETSRTMLGSYFDPVFGPTTSSLYLQLRLSTAEVDLGESPVLDSMIMTMEYFNVTLSGNQKLPAYGDTTTPQTFRIFEIDETFSPDSVYYSNNTLAVKSEQAGVLTFEPHPTDSVMIDAINYPAQFRIKMEDTFVQKFRDASEADFSSLDNFLEFFKGIYITPDEVSMGGAIMFINISSIFTRMTLYYSNAEEDSLEYYFPITSSSARFMNFNHNYMLADPVFQNQLNGDTALGNQTFYLQPMAGIATIIEFPYLKNLSSLGTIALNEAKLKFSNVNKDDVLLPPSELILFSINKEGNNTLLVDELEGDQYFGGIYDASSGQYYFRITQYLQTTLRNDSLPARFYMGVSGASIIPTRVVCNGTSPLTPVDNSQKLQLQLIYTQLSDN